jgi:hypothetical protein
MHLVTTSSFGGGWNRIWFRGWWKGGGGRGVRVASRSGLYGGLSGWLEPRSTVTPGLLGTQVQGGGDDIWILNDQAFILFSILEILFIHLARHIPSVFITRNTTVTTT